MKIAVVYNRESKKVINVFGVPNRERYGLKAIKRFVDALKSGGHQVISLEGDKDLIDRLEEFMPRVLKGERPGMAFNLSYGIQGQARYTHVPGMLEMIGIPYIGSGPLAHSLALDKVVAKMIFRQQGIPTPDFVVLDGPDFPSPNLTFPLIVKPKNEAVSFGIKVVHTEEDLRESAQAIFDKFQQPVLAERYIEGREINVGLLGNAPPEAFLPAELSFGEGGPNIYTYEDKTHRSGREVKVVCPAPLDDKLTKKAQEIAIRAFNALGCYDCARVDMRLDDSGNLYILEINSLPSLGEHGSYVAAAAHMGLDFPALVNRLVEVASARYFGTPQPPKIDTAAVDRPTQVFSFITGRRDQIEQRLQEWVAASSRTSDPVGQGLAMKKLDAQLQEIRMQPVADLTDYKSVWTWETGAGMENGTLLIGHLDIPLDLAFPSQSFHRDPEWLYGEGIGLSRAPLVMLEYALRSLRAHRWLQRLPLGVLYYTDEGNDARYSSETIKKAIERAKQVLVLRPGILDNKIVTERRGQRKYQLVVEGKPSRPGKDTRSLAVLPWVFSKMEKISQLSSRKKRMAIVAMDIHTEGFPMLQPHRATITILLNYPEAGTADAAEKEMKQILGRSSIQWELFLISDRPPLPTRSINKAFADSLSSLAKEWEIPFAEESSVWPSVAGLAPESIPVLCGIGPVSRDLYTSQEAVSRVSLVQRTLLLAQFLLHQLPERAYHEKQ